MLIVWVYVKTEILCTQAYALNTVQCNEHDGRSSNPILSNISIHVQKLYTTEKFSTCTLLNSKSTSTLQYTYINCTLKSNLSKEKNET